MDVCSFQNHFNDSIILFTEFTSTLCFLYSQVIAYNQNVEKLNTLRQKLNKKLEDLETVKGELTEDLAKVIQSHSEAVDQHQKIIANNPNNA